MIEACITISFSPNRFFADFLSCFLLSFQFPTKQIHTFTMNFLADYASDDDETNEEQRPAVVITKPPPSNTVSKPVSSSSSSSSSSSGQNKRDDEGKPKKKQAIIFSALPMEIQNALTQGSSTLDSDSDDDNAGIKGGPKIPSKTTSNGSARNPLGGTGLMSLLPAPKNAASLPKPVVAKSTTTTANSSGTMNAARPLIVAKTTTETVRVAATKQQSAVKTDDDDDDDDDNDDVILPKGRGMDLISQIRNSSAQQALPSMFSMSTTSTSQNNNTKESSAGWLDDEEPEILQLKPQVSSFHMASTDSNGMYGSSSSSSSGDGSMPSIPIAYPQQQDLVSSYPQYQFPQPLPDQPYNDDYGNSNLNSKSISDTNSNPNSNPNSNTNSFLTLP